MKIQGWLLAAVFGLGAMGTSAQAAPIMFTTMLGNFENPATGSAGTGFAAVTMDVVAHTLTVDVFFSGLTGVTTNAHIHCCTASPGNVGVATTTPTFPGFPAGVQAGSYFNIFDTALASSFSPAFVTASSPATVAGAEARLLAGLQAGQAYFNVHTNLFAGGEIRGFLVQCVPGVAGSCPSGPVPEPATFALMGSGLAALAAIRRRRRA